MINYKELKPVLKKVDNPSEVEQIKIKSNFLRGTIKESLENEVTGNLNPDDQQLIKFHGSYVQWDRSLDSERKKQKLEPLYSFMIRVRVPGGIARPSQWLALDKISGQYGINTLKLTTRQAFELHGVLKRNLKTTIKKINDTLLDTLAACGDVNRNVMSSSLPLQTKVNNEIEQVVQAIHKHLTPKTKAYHELWLNDQQVGGGEPDEEPIYGQTYLPRKFKIAIAIPPINDTDVFANDIGLIAVVENGTLIGFNVAAGGGMGMTFGMPDTHPRLGDVLGFVTKDKIVDVVEKIVLIQRDNGNRSNRKFSRLKYTIESMGLESFKKDLFQRLGYEFENSREYNFTQSGDPFGWHQSDDGRWHYVMFVEGGRVKDTDEYPMKKGLNEIAKFHHGSFVLTGNQNLVIAYIPANDKGRISLLLDKYKITQHQQISATRANSLACVALDLCPLAFAEGERYLPKLMDKIDDILIKNNLKEQPINIRMTGCPNGCARPYLAEIGLVGRAPGRYNLYLGASPSGDRLNTLYREMMNEQDILTFLSSILEKYSIERQPNERFGDYVVRAGIVPKMTDSKQFQKVIVSKLS